jgi:ArsR family transcriptional regulator
MRKYLVGRMADILRILAEEQRLKILKILNSSMADTVCVSDVAKLLGISQPAATKHLRLLESIDLLDRKRIGTSVYYSLRNEKLKEYHDLIEYTFEKGRTQCPYDFKCSECPKGVTCI